MVVTIGASQLDHKRRVRSQAACLLKVVLEVVRSLFPHGLFPVALNDELDDVLLGFWHSDPAQRACAYGEDLHRIIFEKLGNAGLAVGRGYGVAEFFG